MSLLLGVSERLHRLTFNNLKFFVLFSFQDFLFIFGFILLDYDMLSRAFFEFVLLGICCAFGLNSESAGKEANFPREKRAKTR